MTAPELTPATEQPAVGAQVESSVRPAAEARWYCLDRDGVAMLCKDKADAIAQAAENDACWPGRAPHRHVALGDVAAERERWRTLLFGPHIYNGECPTPERDQIHWRDAECPACRALGDWKA